MLTVESTDCKTFFASPNIEPFLTRHCDFVAAVRVLLVGPLGGGMSVLSLGRSKDTERYMIDSSKHYPDIEATNPTTLKDRERTNDE